jgi:hypothetical protein
MKSCPEVEIPKTTNLTPKGSKAIFKAFLEVWVGHCKSHIYKQFMDFLVNMWFSTSFKTHKFL